MWDLTLTVLAWTRPGGPPECAPTEKVAEQFFTHRFAGGPPTGEQLSDGVRDLVYRAADWMSSCGYSLWRHLIVQVWSMEFCQS